MSTNGHNYNAFADDSEDDAWAAGWNAAARGDTSNPYEQEDNFWAWESGYFNQLNSLTH